jgi:hypothetical protein
VLFREKEMRDRAKGRREKGKKEYKDMKEIKKG